MALGFLQSEWACWSKSTKIILTEWNQITVEQFIILVKHLFVGFIRAHKKKHGIELQKLKAMQNLKDYHDICPGLAADFAVEKKTETGNASIIETNYINFVIN